MHFHIPLPGGMLKVKTYRYLRASEREHKVPLWRLGQIYFIWRKNSLPA